MLTWHGSSGRSQNRGIPAAHRTAICIQSDVGRSAVRERMTKEKQLELNRDRRRWFGPGSAAASARGGQWNLYIRRTALSAGCECRRSSARVARASFALGRP